MEQPIIYNPPNPYVGSLRIFPGTLVKIAGQPQANAARFAINLQTGPSLNPRDDLALHLSPSFTPPRMIRNSLQSGAWGIEEAWGNGSELSPYQPFEIMILAEANQFKIALNGQHYCEFAHRIPYQHITHLTIDGDVDIEKITISSQHQPATAPPPPLSSYPAPNPAGYSSGTTMPMPPMYPNLGPSAPPSAHYPSMPMPQAPAGPAATGASYSSAGPHYPAPPAAPSYPQPMPAAYGQPAHGYPGAGAGPAPTGSGYQHGYPQQPGHSSNKTSTPFGNLPIGGKALGTLAGLGLGAAAGAAVLSAAASPFKSVKKIMKPHKMFKHSGFKRSSSSSSNSSGGSFSSNSS